MKELFYLFHHNNLGNLDSNSRPRWRSWTRMNSKGGWMETRSGMDPRVKKAPDFHPGGRCLCRVWKWKSCRVIWTNWSSSVTSQTLRNWWNVRDVRGRSWPRWHDVFLNLTDLFSCFKLTEPRACRCNSHVVVWIMFYVLLGVSDNEPTQSLVSNSYFSVDVWADGVFTHSDVSKCLFL